MKGVAGANQRQSLPYSIVEVVMTSILIIVVDLISYIVIAHIVMSWLINFSVLDTKNDIVYQIWRTLEQLVEPVYSRIRKFLPNTGMIDLSPFIVLIAIFLIKELLRNGLV